jgi:hypothetical protein
VDKVLVLKGLPLVTTAVVLAHELGHCLLCKEGITLSRREEEGLCELLAFLWVCEMDHVLSTIDQQNAGADATASDEPSSTYEKYFSLIRRLKLEDLRYQKRRIEGNSSHIYGDGFRDALESLNRGIYIVLLNL